MTTKETYKRGDGTKTAIRMQRIIDFIRDYHKANDYAPTLGEIAVGIGMKETDVGNVHPLVKALIEQGFLESAGKNQTRGLRVAKRMPRKYFYRE